MEAKQRSAEALTVLVVDDEPVLRRLMGQILIEAGFKVVEAENGEAALATARESIQPPGLVVTDISMPVMTGIEFAREFRPLNPTVPILFISGMPPYTRSESFDRGGDFLAKPFGAEALLEAVTRLLDRNYARLQTPA